MTLFVIYLMLDSKEGKKWVSSGLSHSLAFFLAVFKTPLQNLNKQLLHKKKKSQQKFREYN